MTELAVDIARTTLAVPPAAPTQLVADLAVPAVLEVAPRGASLAVEVLRAGVLLAPAAQGPMGPPAPALPYPISNAASFTARHGLDYPPRTWIVDPNGDVLDTDTHHAPGQVTVVFASPFTGTLYLG